VHNQNKWSSSTVVIEYILGITCDTFENVYTSSSNIRCTSTPASLKLPKFFVDSSQELSLWQQRHWVPTVHIILATDLLLQQYYQTPLFYLDQYRNHTDYVSFHVLVHWIYESIIEHRSKRLSISAPRENYQWVLLWIYYYPTVLRLHFGVILWRQPPDFAFALATLHQRHFTVMPLT